MDLQSVGTIVGILSGLVTLIGAVTGVYDRLQERRHGGQAAQIAAVPAGSYAPPASTVSGPTAHPSGPMPPPVSRWPGTPPPGAAPTPRPGYGPPAALWSNAPRPALSQPTPYYPPQPTRRTWRSRLAPPGSSRWFPYPIVLIGATTYFILSVIYSSATSGPNANIDPSSDPFLSFVLLLATITYLGTVIYAATQAIRLRRWGWLVSILLIVAYGMAAFGIFGPTTRPQPKMPASYGPYPPYPPRRI